MKPDAERPALTPGQRRRLAARRLDPGQQSLLSLARLGKGETFAELAAGTGWPADRPFYSGCEYWCAARLAVPRGQPGQARETAG